VIETALLWKHMRFQKVTSKVKSLELITSDF